jgi:hypothetical protein
MRKPKIHHYAQKHVLLGPAVRQLNTIDILTTQSLRYVLILSLNIIIGL